MDYRGSSGRRRHFITRLDFLVADSIVIVDKMGAEGVWHGETESDSGRLVIVEFNGQRYHVPRTSLVEQGEGEFLLPLALEDLELARQVIPVIREEVHVGKREVNRQVRIETRVAEREETVEIPLETSEIIVERTPKDELLEAVPEVRTEGDVTIIPVIEERLVVTKQLYLIEEVRVSHKRSTDIHRETVTLREENVEVHRSGEEGEKSM